MRVALRVRGRRIGRERRSRATVCDRRIHAGVVRLAMYDGAAPVQWNTCGHCGTCEREGIARSEQLPALAVAVAVAAAAA